MEFYFKHIFKFNTLKINLKNKNYITKINFYIVLNKNKKP